MSKPYAIHYNDFKTLLEVDLDSSGGLSVDHHLKNSSWGNFSERTMALEHFKIFSFDADFEKPFRIHYDDHEMPNMVNLCLSLEGHIEVEFPQLRAGLGSSSHHGMYIDETKYDVITQKIKVVHIEIDHSYFLNLLCDSEPWSAALKDRLRKQETVLSGVGKLTPTMRRTLFELLHAPFHGSLQKMLVEAKVLEVIAHQLRHYSEINQTGRRSLSDRDLFEGIREYLDASFLQPHSLKGLARQFGVNEFKLKKGFRENFSTSVFEYLLDKRMSHARALLLDNNLNVCEVSRQVGYKNPNHFSTAFKKRFGTSPAALKN